jgi:hypothetical protein
MSDKPVNRVHEQFNPCGLTRLLSIGRQLKRMCAGKYTLRKGCDAAKMVKAQQVSVISVTVDRTDGEVLFGVVAVKGDTTRTGLATWEDFEECSDAGAKQT